MSGCFLQGPVSGEHHGLDCVEVLVQEISVLLTGEVAHALLDAQLDAAHQLGRLELLVGHLPVLHPPVSQLLPLDDAIFGVIGGPVAVGPGDGRLGPQHPVLGLQVARGLVDGDHCRHSDVTLRLGGESALYLQCEHEQHQIVME